MSAILEDDKPDFFEVNAEVLRLQEEAAKDPNHPINDGLRAYFEERKRKLEQLNHEKK